MNHVFLVIPCIAIASVHGCGLFIVDVLLQQRRIRLIVYCKHVATATTYSVFSICVTQEAAAFASHIFRTSNPQSNHGLSCLLCHVAVATGAIRVVPG